jgi:hypothetical protein
MNPYHRTGAGTVDDKTTRVVFASNSPKFTADGVEYDRIDASYYMGTDNRYSITYRLDGQIVRYVTFEYIDDPNTTVGARVSKITILPAPLFGQGDTDDPEDDEIMMGWSGGPGGPIEEELPF